MKAPPKKPADYARIKRRVFKIAELQDAPYNARSITQDALRGLTESLSRFGVLALPIVNVKHSPPRIVGGHQRIAALRQMGVEDVECVVVNFDEATERQANFTLNNPHIEGTFVPALTRELLEELAKACADQDLLPDLRLDALLKQVVRNAEATTADKVVKVGKIEDDVSEPPAKSTAVSKAGQVYALGEHRILCGKLSAPGDIAALGVDRASMAFVTLTNLPDNPSAEILDVLIRHALQNTSGAVYLSTRTDTLPIVHARLVECGGHWSNTIVCYHEAAPSKKVPFNCVSTALVYGWPEGQQHPFYGGLSRGNVWKLKTPVGQHAPVEVAVQAIQDSSAAGQRVLDVMADGGTTLIAAEKTGRKLVGYVSSPREADRVRRRWSQFVHGEGADWKALTVSV